MSAEETLIRPVGEYVLVKVDAPPESTPSGLLLPRPKSRMPTRGVVLAVGPGRWQDARFIPDEADDGEDSNRVVTGHWEEARRIPVDLKPGEVVYFSHTVGKDLKVGGEYYLLVEESKVLMAVSVGE
jgi:chaperonin GroES